MRWVCLQHAPFEGPAWLETWARAQDHRLERVELWTGAAPPPLDDATGLFVLGGPMNVDDEARYPWLTGEKRYLEKAVRERRPVLGVCLGAQLLAAVLGASVTRNEDKEIGWFPVHLLPSARGGPLFRGFPERFMAFHWHGDRFAIPCGAVHVARSVGCAEQAFVYENHAVGLQFHLEVTRASIASLIAACGAEIVPARFIQDPAAMAAHTSRVPTAHALLGRLLTDLVAVAVSGPPVREDTPGPGR